jgi:hypothetical protein
VIFYIDISCGKECGWKNDITNLLKENGYQIYTQTGKVYKIDTVTKNVFAQDSALNAYKDNTSFDVIRKLLQ